MSNQLKKGSFLGLGLLVGLMSLGSLDLRATERKTMEGTITDAMCGATHKMQGMSAVECTLGCVDMGSKYALVVGTEVYELNGMSDQLKALAGQKVKLTGDVGGKSIQVVSVSKG